MTMVIGMARVLADIQLSQNNIHNSIFEVVGSIHLNELRNGGGGWDHDYNSFDDDDHDHSWVLFVKFLWKWKLLFEGNMLRIIIVNQHLLIIVWNKVTTKRSPTSRVTTKLVVGNPCFVIIVQYEPSPSSSFAPEFINLILNRRPSWSSATPVSFIIIITSSSYHHHDHQKVQSRIRWHRAPG